VGVADLTLELAQQFLVRVSTDGTNWLTVLEETRAIRNLDNRADYPVDLSGLNPDSDALYVWIGDSQPDDGWGAWIARVQLDMQAG
jgi:hypothetical protein